MSASRTAAEANPNSPRKIFASMASGGADDTDQTGGWPAGIGAPDKEKIAHLNAERLLRLSG